MSELNSDNKTRIDEYITTNDCEENDSIPVNLKGEKKRLQVYRLPIELLYYNIRNGRFAAEYINEVKKQGGELKPEDKEDAKKIKNLLWNLDVNESKRTYDDIKDRGQWLPGIITEDGYVIDGNRRMTILSKLFEDTSNDEFKFIKVGRLPGDVDKNDLWKLEAGIQLGKDEILRYGPMNELLKLRQGVNAGITTSEIAKTLYGIDDKDEIELKLDRLERIDEYLVHVGKPGDYKLADRKVEHFAELQKIIVTEDRMGVDTTTRQKIKFAVFCLIYDGIGHRELRKIERMVRIQLDTAIKKIISLGEKCQGKAGIEEPIPEEPDEEDGENSEIGTIFEEAGDELGAEENKDKVAEMLRKAATFLDAIDYQNPDLQKPEVKDVIKRILRSAKKLEEIGK
ncbi:hypothetical protein OAJ83_03565 [Candidatus Nitrosopelagicus sp.]|nr:hypothetical protein [Candidatus Nitrosopelagicus sp.]